MSATVGAQPIAVSGHSQSAGLPGVGDEANTKIDVIDANALVARAAIAITQHAAVSAKIRQRINLFSQQLVGSGTYWQGSWRQRLYRLELRIQVADQVSTLLQVSDGENLWIYRELFDSRLLERIDLAQIRDSSTGVAPDGSGSNVSAWLGSGGLPGLLGGLARSFHFSERKETTLGGVATIQLTGEWKPKILAELLPSQQETIAAGKTVDLSKLADQLPDQVVLWLGRADLVPYRIDFRRRYPARHTHVETIWPKRATTPVADRKSVV